MKHLGDFLTFQSISAALGIPHSDFSDCEISSGIWRRYPNLPVEKSRSDISRDGVLGVLFWGASEYNQDPARRIFWAGLKNRFRMGERGDWDYVSVLPIAPLIAACAFGAWVPTPPTLPFGPLKTGFRAHLVALTILIERAIGKRKWVHKKGTQMLLEANPDNPFFKALLAQIEGTAPVPYPKITEDSPFGWGSCPAVVYNGLISYCNNTD